MGKSEYVQYDLSKLTNSSNTMIIPNGYFNGNSIATFNISNNGVLKHIEIGNDCFGKVRVFELNGLSELESVVIGNDSFTNTKDADPQWNEIPAQGSFRIQNCPKLKSLEVGVCSFADYHMFSLVGLIE